MVLFIPIKFFIRVTCVIRVIFLHADCTEKRGLFSI